MFVVLELQIGLQMIDENFEVRRTIKRYISNREVMIDNDVFNQNEGNICLETNAHKR